MTIGEKYAEYGITGTFFAMGQIGCYFLLRLVGIGPTPADLLTRVQAALQHFPKDYSTLLTGSLGAFALASVISAGIILDLLGSVHALWEASLFRRELDKNRSWVTDLLRNAEELQSDSSSLMTEFGDPISWREQKQALAVSMRVFLFWRAKNRAAYAQLVKKAWRGWALAKAQRRLHAFLTSYILVFSGIGNVDFLTDQMRLWRVSRALSTALILLSMEAGIIAYVSTYVRPAMVYVVIPIEAAVIVCTYSAFFMTAASYARLCSALFSLTFVTMQKNQRADRASAQAGASR